MKEEGGQSEDGTDLYEDGAAAENESVNNGVGRQRSGQQTTEREGRNKQSLMGAAKASSGWQQ